MSSGQQCDIARIQDEDVLRQMWQDADDFGQKKQIRARMYKLREARLKQFYETSSETKTTTHADALMDHSFTSIKSKEVRDAQSPTRDISFKSDAGKGWSITASGESATQTTSRTANQHHTASNATKTYATSTTTPPTVERHVHTETKTLPDGSRVTTTRYETSEHGASQSQSASYSQSMMASSSSTQQRAISSSETKMLKQHEEKAQQQLKQHQESIEQCASSASTQTSHHQAKMLKEKTHSSSQTNTSSKQHHHRHEKHIDKRTESDLTRAQIGDFISTERRQMNLEQRDVKATPHVSEQHHKTETRIERTECTPREIVSHVKVTPQTSSTKKSEHRTSQTTEVTRSEAAIQHTPSDVKPTSMPEMVQKPSTIITRTRPVSPPKSSLDTKPQPTEGQYITTYRTEFVPKKISVEVSATHDAFARSLRSVTPERDRKPTSVHSGSETSVKETRRSGNKVLRRTDTYEERCRMILGIDQRKKSQSPEKMGVERRRSSASARISEVRRTSNGGPRTSPSRERTPQTKRRPASPETRVFNRISPEKKQSPARESSPLSKTFSSTERRRSSQHIVDSRRSSTATIVVDRKATSPPSTRVFKAKTTPSPSPERQSRRPSSQTKVEHVQTTFVVRRASPSTNRRHSSPLKENVRPSSDARTSFTKRVTEEFASEMRRGSLKERAPSPQLQEFPAQKRHKTPEKETSLKEKCPAKKRHKTPEKATSSLAEFPAQKRHKTPEKETQSLAEYPAQKRPKTPEKDAPSLAEFPAQKRPKTPEEEDLSLPDCAIIKRHKTPKKDTPQLQEFPSQKRPKTPEMDLHTTSVVSIEHHSINKVKSKVSRKTPEKEVPISRPRTPTSPSQLQEFPSQIRRPTPEREARPARSRSKTPEHVAPSQLQEFPAQIRRPTPEREAPPPTRSRSKTPDHATPSQLQEFPSQIRRHPTPEKECRVSPQRDIPSSDKDASDSHPKLQEFPAQIRRKTPEKETSPAPRKTPERERSTPPREAAPTLQEFPAQIRRKTPEKETSPTPRKTPERERPTTPRETASSLQEFPAQIRDVGSASEKEPSPPKSKKSRRRSPKKHRASLQLTAEEQVLTELDQCIAQSVERKTKVEKSERISVERQQEMEELIESENVQDELMRKTTKTKVEKAIRNDNAEDELLRKTTKYIEDKRVPIDEPLLTQKFYSKLGPDEEETPTSETHKKPVQKKVQHQTVKKDLSLQEAKLNKLTIKQNWTKEQVDEALEKTELVDTKSTLKPTKLTESEPLPAHKTVKKDLSKKSQEKSSHSCKKSISSDAKSKPDKKAPASKTCVSTKTITITQPVADQREIIVDLKRSISSREDGVWPTIVQHDVYEAHPRLPDKIVEPDEPAPRTCLIIDEALESGDECLLSVSDKVNKFKTASDNCAKPITSQPAKKVPRPSFTVDESLASDECLLSVSDKVTKFLTTAERLASTDRPKSPRCMNYEDKPGDVDSKKRPEVTSPVTRKSPPTRTTIDMKVVNLSDHKVETTTAKETLKQRDILSRPSVFEAKRTHLDDVRRKLSYEDDKDKPKDVKKMDTKPSTIFDSKPRVIVQPVADTKHVTTTNVSLSDLKVTKQRDVLDASRSSDEEPGYMRQLDRSLRIRSPHRENMFGVVLKRTNSGRSSYNTQQEKLTTTHVEDVQLTDTKSDRRRAGSKSPQRDVKPSNKFGVALKRTDSQRNDSHHVAETIICSKTTHQTSNIVDREVNKPANKFGVVLKRTDSQRSDSVEQRRRSSALSAELTSTQKKPEPEIEEIFDLQVLETMLETVRVYELRRRIRAQIRIVKLQISDEQRRERITARQSVERKPTSPNDAKSQLGFKPFRRSPETRVFHPEPKSSPEWTKPCLRKVTTPLRTSPSKERTQTVSEERSSVTRVTQRKIDTVDDSSSRSSSTKRSSPSKDQTVKKIDTQPEWTKTCLKKATDRKTVSKTVIQQQQRRSPSKEKQVTKKVSTDVITSSYGVGPTDEHGAPLFGLKALRAQKSTKVQGSVIKSQFHAETGKEPVGEVTVTQYSTDPNDFDDGDGLLVRENGIASKTVTQKFGSRDSSFADRKKISPNVSKTNDAMRTKVERRGSVKQMSKKFLENTVETKRTEKSSSAYPKAGLILRTSSFKERKDSTSRESSPTAGDVVETTRTSCTTTSGSFLTDRSKVTGMQDIIQRMQTEETTSEDAEARNILNKFLGAQVLMTGIENAMGSPAKVESRRSTKITTTQTVDGVATTNTRIFEHPVTEEVLLSVNDEESLRLLLGQSEDYEERRIIRCRLKEVMADLEEKGRRFSDGATQTKTQVTTTTRTQKTMSPVFAKFRQMEMASSGLAQLSDAPSFTVTDANSIKERLLQWCRAKTQEYENVKLDNFSTSWADGLAFCALIHHFLPHSFEYHTLKAENRRHNFTLAFQVAEEKADIPPLLDVDDMVATHRPDWKCVFTYVQAIYRRFKDAE